MFLHLFVLIFLFVDRSISHQDYFIRYSLEDIPCVILQIDQRWIQCIINRSDPLKIFSRTLSTPISIELIFTSMENFILPAKFLENENDFVQYNLIIFDLTKDSNLKQINISSELFVNLFATKIYFILHECGHPVIHIADQRFHSHSNDDIFIIYHNRSRTVAIENYFSDECLLEREIDFHWSRNTKKINKQIYSMKLWINTSLFSILILLTTILMCLIRRRESDRIQIRSWTPSEMSTPAVSNSQANVISSDLPVH